MAEINRTDGLVGNAAIKYPCRMASTTNLTLSGLQTIDGIVGAQDDRVLVKDQTTGTQNGIYVMDSGTWERAQDADNDGAFTEGSLVKVNNGTVGSGFWYITNTGTITIDSTSIAFGKASSTLAVVSAYWQTVLQLTTAALSRTQLGLGTGDSPTFTGLTTTGAATPASVNTGAITATTISGTTITATSINFGQTTLNYYGEGTFTPSVGGSATYSSQSGKYTRVGRFVHCDVNLGITTLGTGSASTVSGMPFSLGASPDGNGAMGRFTSLAIACTSITPQWGASSSQVTFMTTNAAMTTGTTNDAIMGNGTTMRFSVSGQT
ncbi:hypothetical protein UFOVP1670_31 [uncultured Caudovirales phage]|uniref:Major tropism determinant N-terminal domain-containing protein n=1 Tax=uncultured Caudovirales phage TaxID=2100421 RepID=A0A6J5T6K2_9CAUD|nr:hypothetical protein UFOVP1670_31 [uncultured Caudovirales phage]